MGIIKSSDYIIDMGPMEEKMINIITEEKNKL